MNFNDAIAGLAGDRESRARALDSLADATLTLEQALDVVGAIKPIRDHLTPQELAGFQIRQRRLCVPFQDFHRAVETTIGHPVMTHEFALDYENLRREVMSAIATPNGVPR